MDRKHVELVSRCTETIRDRAFGESEVLLLLILLRESALQNSALVELAHFVAHRRRSRGEFHDFVRRGHGQAHTPSGLRVGLDAEPLFSSAEVIASINTALRHLGIDELPVEIGAEVGLFVISLLQDVEFVDGEKTIGRLFMAYDPHWVYSIAQIELDSGDAQIVPVLRVENQWFSWSGIREVSGLCPILAIANNWITVVRVGECLELLQN